MIYHKVKLLFSFVLLTSLASTSSSLCLDIARWSPQDINWNGIEPKDVGKGLAIGLAALNVAQFGFKCYHFHERYNNRSRYKKFYIKTIEDKSNPLKVSLGELKAHRRNKLNKMRLSLTSQQQSLNKKTKKVLPISKKPETASTQKVFNVSDDESDDESNDASNNDSSNKSSFIASLSINDICSSLINDIDRTMIIESSNLTTRLRRSLLESKNTTELSQQKHDYLNVREEVFGSEKYSFYNYLFTFFNSTPVSFLSFIGAFLFDSFERGYNCYDDKVPNFQNDKVPNFQKTKNLFTKDLNEELDAIYVDQLNAIKIIAKMTRYNDTTETCNKVLQSASKDNLKRVGIDVCAKNNNSYSTIFLNWLGWRKLTVESLRNMQKTTKRNMQKTTKRNIHKTTK
ncbi:MAG: hypothetical protein WBQ73_00320 [Candidatus Babeliales bacterium]